MTDDQHGPTEGSSPDDDRQEATPGTPSSSHLLSTPSTATTDDVDSREGLSAVSTPATDSTPADLTESQSNVETPQLSAKTDDSSQGDNAGEESVAFTPTPSSNSLATPADTTPSESSVSQPVEQQQRRRLPKRKASRSTTPQRRSPRTSVVNARNRANLRSHASSASTTALSTPSRSSRGRGRPRKSEQTAKSKTPPKTASKTASMAKAKLTPKRKAKNKSGALSTPDSTFEEKSNARTNEDRESPSDQDTQAESKEESHQSDDNQDKNAQEQSEATDDETSSSSAEDDSDDDYGTKRKSKASKKKLSPKKTTRSPTKTKGGKKVEIQIGFGKGTGGKHSTRGGAFGRGVNSAIATLARNVLPDGEEPGMQSLIAGLFHSYRPVRGVAKNIDIEVISCYTLNLHALASKVISVHNDDPNRAQISLLNLLFRSIGGSPQTDLSEDMVLEDMETDEWARVVTDLVDDMRHTPAQQIPLCADPLGAVHASQCLAGDDQGGGPQKLTNKETQYSIGVAEFRKIFCEFWYILAIVALVEGGMSTISTRRHEEISKGDTSPMHVVRLDAELAKDIIMRIVELAPVGQPDVRAAATLAVLHMGHAVLDQTSQLVKKIDVANRQYSAATQKGKKQGAKAEALKVRIDSLKRSLSNLEEIVLGPVIQGIFVHRYRDSNDHTRTICINALSRMTLQRPDIFLTDKYLKYFGWMMHDKSKHVRVASLSGLLRPFLAVHDAAAGKARAPGDGYLMIEKIDLSYLEHVVAKFLPKIADCVIDIDPEVQEVGMELMLMLLKDGFLDEVEDDQLWNQINLRALAPDAPPKVRRNALYFILEQLEAFDEGDDDEGNADRSPAPKTVESTERKRSQQLDAIASYAAHAMTNGPIPIDKIRVELADLLVLSLRDMPDHRELVTDWSAMLRAIRSDNAAATAHNVRAGERANVAKQRVLVRMLACAAREEVGSVADSAFLQRDTDVEMAENRQMGATKKTSSSSRKPPSMSREHENLSVALLKALPGLLIQFKGDLAIIPELASLPRFLIPTVFSLPQRKQDFTSLIKNLGEVYLSSSDEKILSNAALSIVSLSHGDHARVADAEAELRKVTVELRDRIVDMMSTDDTVSVVVADPDYSESQSQPSQRPSSKAKSYASIDSSRMSLTADDDSSRSAAADAEYSIFLNLKRLKIISKRRDLSLFFDSSDDIDQLEPFCNFICDGLKRRLQLCLPLSLRDRNEDDDDDDQRVIDSPDMLVAIGKSVQEGLEFILCTIGWSLLSVQRSENLVKSSEDLIEEVVDDDIDSPPEDHIVIRLRNRLLSLLELCFAQYIPDQEEQDNDDQSEVSSAKKSLFSAEQIAFADFVQVSAGRVTSDLRTLFPKELSDAASPLLRSFALSDDGRLIGAFVRFLGSKEKLLRANENSSSENKKLPYSLLLPMARAIATNWTNGNRREAGMFLRHITSSGPTSSEVVSTTSRVLKKIDAVRLLESQMASLRQSYEKWVDDEPDVESDQPTDEEMAEFEEAEKKHRDQFAELEQRASNFSQLLGTYGKLKDTKLGQALTGFIREGVRFSFSNIDSNGEDTLVLGSRLSFLLLLSKYSNWAKKNKQNKIAIQKYIDDLETEMTNHPEFQDVHEDDLEALAVFRINLGLRPLPKPTESDSVQSSRKDSLADDESLDTVSELNITSTSSIPKSNGRRSSVSTLKSRSSHSRGSLPPLPEAEEESPPGHENENNKYNALANQLGTNANEDEVNTPQSVATMDEDKSDFGTNTPRVKRSNMSDESDQLTPGDTPLTDKSGYSEFTPSLGSKRPRSPESCSQTTSDERAGLDNPCYEGEEGSHSERVGEKSRKKTRTK